MTSPLPDLCDVSPEGDHGIRPYYDDAVPAEDRRTLELEGKRLASLIIGWEWIDRRVESVTCLSETRALREISITLTLPDRLPPAKYTGPIELAQVEPRASSRDVEQELCPESGAAAPQAAGSQAEPGPRQRFYYVPLTLIDKEKMTRFDFIDERGASLPLLGSVEKAVMAAGLLVSLADRTLKEEAEWKGKGKRKGKGKNSSLPVELANRFRAIAESPPKEARELLDGFMDRSGRCGIYKVLHGQSRNARVLRALLQALAHCYILVVPLSHSHYQKRLIKFSYEENFTFKIAPQLAGSWSRRVGQWLVRLTTDQMRTFGWKARQVWLGAPAFGHGGTYHLEMSAPPGTKITQMTLVGLAVEPEMTESQLIWVSSQGIGISARLEEQYQPHVCCRDKKPGAFAVAYTKIRLTSPTVIRAAFFAALGTALALIVGGHFLGHLLAEGSTVTGAGAALLLAVPTAASIYISRVEEHPMVTNMLLGVRLASLLSGASAFAAAGVLILGHYVKTKGNWEGEAKTAWVICSIAAAVAALALMGTYFATWKEDQPLIPRLRRYRTRWAAPPTYPPPPPPER